MSFFILLAFNILCISVISYLVFPLFKQVPEHEPSSQTPLITESEPFYLYAGKETIAHTINSFLRDTGESVAIALNDYIVLNADIAIFGLDVSLQAQFEPIVDSSGNLLLKQRSVSFGFFDLPNEYALQYMANAIDLPPWVYIQPQQESIYIDLLDAQFDTKVQLQVEQFDLIEDEIIFLLHFD